MCSPCLEALVLENANDTANQASRPFYLVFASDYWFSKSNFPSPARKVLSKTEEQGVCLQEWREQLGQGQGMKTLLRSHFSPPYRIVNSDPAQERSRQRDTPTKSRP